MLKCTGMRFFFLCCWFLCWIAERGSGAAWPSWKWKWGQFLDWGPAVPSTAPQRGGKQTETKPKTKTETRCFDIFALKALNGRQRLQSQPKCEQNWKAVVAVFLCGFFLHTFCPVCPVIAVKNLLVSFLWLVVVFVFCQPKVLLPYSQHKCVILNAVAKCQPASPSGSRLLHFCLSRSSTLQKLTLRPQAGPSIEPTLNPPSTPVLQPHTRNVS